MERSVADFGRRMTALQRSSQVRYVVGSYDTYRETGPGLVRQAYEQDQSYLPALYGGGDDHSYDLAYGDEDDLYADYEDGALLPAGYEDVYGEVGDEALGDLEGHEDLDEDELYGDEAVARGAVVSGVRRFPTPATRVSVLEAPSTSVAGAQGSQASRVALRRRRQTFATLALALAASLVAAVALRSVHAWVVHGAALLLFAGYVGLLVWHHQRMIERASKVRHLQPAVQPAPARRPARIAASGGAAR
jgi:hypothetical protein